jgi:lysophospholipase L1-like esterase
MKSRSRHIPWNRQILPIAILFQLWIPNLFAQVDTTRIMLLGDSITKGILGSTPIGGFRDDLDFLLTDAGGEYDFVGTLNDGVGFDADHEGHGGFTVDMILANIDSFLNVEDPEIILIHLGTNDISANQGISSTVNEMDSLLDRIYLYNPAMIVHLSALIPRNDSTGTEKDSLTTELNSRYLDLVIDWGDAGYDIKYVDHNTAFRREPNWAVEYLFDHVHPTNEGYQVMAETYFDSLRSEDIFDDIPPAAITDLMVDTVSSRTALLRWTATGDNGITGTADWYDVRYLKDQMITESNFDSAHMAVGEPTPLPSGNAETFTVGGLEPNARYYFAVKAMDEADNPSPVSNSPDDITFRYISYPDDFERPLLGDDWPADEEFVVIDGELSNESIEERWDFMAVFEPVTGNEEINLRWGSNADSLGIGEGGFALMLDTPSPSASGYMVFRHTTFNYYALWTIVGGVPDVSVAQSPVSTLPFPRAGDRFQIVLSSDVHGHHFDCYINGIYDTRVSDPGKLQGNGTELWAGVMLHGNRNNNLEDFWIIGSNANVAPHAFSLLSPPDGSTVETGTPVLDWEDSADPNLPDSVLYSLEYGMSAVFAPESTMVIDDLNESEYSIPPMELVTLVRHSMGSFSSNRWGRTAGDETVTMGTSIGGAGPLPFSLPDDVVIYWRVRAYDTGDLETWSLETDWSFSVSIPEPPLPFSLLIPADRDTVQNLTPTLIWQATTDPDPEDEITYTVYYDTDSLFTSPTTIMASGDTAVTTSPLRDSTTYYWKVEAVDSHELVTESTETYRFLVLLGTGISDGGGGRNALPRVFALSQNYPNPFNPSTSIRYDIPVGASIGDRVPVLLQIFTLRGQLIKTLENDRKSLGSHVVHWDGRNDRGESIGSGVYLYRIQAGTFSATKKMVVLK